MHITLSCLTEQSLEETVPYLTVILESVCLPMYCACACVAMVISWDRHQGKHKVTTRQFGVGVGAMSLQITLSSYSQTWKLYSRKNVCRKMNTKCRKMNTKK